MAYEPLPTKEQINAIKGISDLEAIRDEIDRRVAKIETDLDFLVADEDWDRRARNALAFHRYTLGIVSRRIASLTKAEQSPFGALKGAKTAPRERTECDPMTWDLIENGPLNIDGIETTEAIDAAINALTEQMGAVERDRADEIGHFVPAARDEVWLFEAGAALKAAKAVRHELSLRKAALRYAAKEAARAARDDTRNQRFVAEARAMLPRETFLMLWDRVDRQYLPADSADQAA